VTPFDPRLPIIAADARVKTCHVYHCWCAMREMGKRFHIAAFAQFAGLSTAHVEAIISALDTHDAMPDKRSPTTHRASRLPDDWKAPDDWIDFAVRDKQWRPDDARLEAELFGNYWHAKAGKDATKLDWRKTWINWVRNSRRPQGDYTYASAAAPQISRDEQLRRTADLYDRMGRTVEADEIRKTLSTAEIIPFNRIAG